MAMYGYSVHERTSFVVDYWPAFNELASVIKGLFPGAELPDTPLGLTKVYVIPTTERASSQCKAKWRRAAETLECPKRLTSEITVLRKAAKV